MSFTPSVVSDSYIYEPAPRAPDGHSYRTEWQSEAASYGLGGIVRIPLSQVERGFVNVENSWLNLTIKNVTLAGTGLTAAGVRMSHIGGSACFDQVNVINSGAYVQHTTQYQAVYALNFVANTDANNSLGNSITNNSAKPATGGTSSADYTALLGNILPVTAATTTAAVQTGTLTMSIPLMGIFSDEKAFPLGMLASETVLELYLTNDIKNIFFNNAASGTLTGLGSAEFVVSFDAMIEVVSPNAFREIKAASSGHNGIVTWSSTEQRASSNTIRLDELNVAALMEKQVLLTGVKPRKLLSIVGACFKDNSNGNYDKWAMVQPFAETESGVQWQIGTKLYPPRKIANKAEIVKHLSECYNQSAYTTQANRFNDNSFENRIPTTTDAAEVKTDIVRSAFGVDLTSYDKENDGVDVSQCNIMLGGNLKLNDSVTETSNYQLVSVKRFAVLYSVSDSGNMVVSY
jgi:hypothetical protein